MNKRFDTALAFDPVERFATDILRHPDRADDLKDRLRRQIGLSVERAAPVDAGDPADLDDLWDNVPV